MSANVFGFISPFVCSSGQILLPQYDLVNGMSNLDETHREYSLAHTYDRVRFWRSKVKLTAGSHRHPRRRWGVEVLLLVSVCGSVQ